MTSTTVARKEIIAIPLCMKHIMQGCERMAVQIHVTNPKQEPLSYLKRLLDYQAIHQPVICINKKQPIDTTETLTKQQEVKNLHDIRFSIAIPSDLGIHQLSTYKLVAAISIHQAISDYLKSEHQIVSPLQLKWPNNLIMANTNIAPTNLETYHDSNRQIFIILNIHIHLKLILRLVFNALHCLPSNAISNQPINMNKLFLQIIKKIIDDFALLKENCFSLFMPQWQKHDYLTGKQITIKQQQTCYRGLYEGISNQAALILKLEDGTTQHYHYGSILSVR